MTHETDRLQAIMEPVPGVIQAHADKITQFVLRRIRTAAREATQHHNDAFGALLAACESHGMSCGLADNGPDLLELVADQLESVGLDGFVESLRIKAKLEREAIIAAGRGHIFQERQGRG